MEGYSRGVNNNTMFKGTGSNGLVIGIDIQNDVSMVSYIDETGLTSVNVTFSDGRSFKENPVSADRWPQIIREGYSGQLEDICSFFTAMIEQAKKTSGRIKVGMIALTVYDFNTELLDSIGIIMEKLNIPDQQWRVISHEEAYVYYAYNQKKELYSPGVMLLDYQETGMHCYLCSDKKMGGKIVIMENSYILASDTVNRAGNRDLPLSQVSAEIIEWLQEILTDHYVASVYLTGRGFDVEVFPQELTKFLCNHRKVFAGQNIYVKGASFCGYEELNPMSQNHMIIACHNRIATGIEMDIVERGKLKRLRVLKPGTNWYAASRKYQFIAEDLNEIKLYMMPCNGKQEYMETIDVSGIPYRQGKMTRLDVEFNFTADNKCNVTIRDKGFGDFVKSSGKVINEQFDIV
ncbi:MAG: DUF5716 family protein [Lachnospira sp.]|nr:DUF5716 family protein [Lachnospira sp.]